MNLRIYLFSIGILILNLLNAHGNDILLNQGTLQMPEALHPEDFEKGVAIAPRLAGPGV